LNKLTLIGSGAMARALAIGLHKEYNIKIVGRDEEKLQKLKESISNTIEIATFNEQYNIENENIILCIKPHALNLISHKLIGKANQLYSILAGVTINNISKYIDSKHYIRVMPNLSALYNHSMTTITGDEAIKDEALNIFKHIGKTLWVSTQKELDIATAIAGSGPAFLALVAEAMIDGGVNQGLKREDANHLVQGLFDGFAPLLDHNTASDIKNNVMSPSGTTSAGYMTLEKNGVRYAFMETIKEAYHRALELDRK
jgi:pyrroline-5-carboxylate reductase